MAVDVEEVLNDLLDVIQASAKTSFEAYSRRLKFWTDAQKQPALFLRHVADDDSYSGEGLGIIVIEAEVWIYCKATNDPNAAPDTALNALVKKVRCALMPDDDDGRFSLGGLVWRCRIEGRSEYDPGDTDEQSKAVLPIRIMLP